jgi:hypothetical protein
MKIILILQLAFAVAFAGEDHWSATWPLKLFKYDFVAVPSQNPIYSNYTGGW